MPSHQIVLGVPSYGHSFRVSSSSAFDGNSLALYPAFDANSQPVGDKWDDGAGPDTCGVQQGPGGVFDFWGMVDGGFLNADGNPGSGIEYVFDDCSQTVSFSLRCSRTLPIDEINERILISFIRKIYSPLYTTRLQRS